MSETEKEQAHNSTDFEKTLPAININWVVTWIFGGFGIVSWCYSTFTSDDIKFWLLGLYLILLASGMLYREYAFDRTKSRYAARIKELHRGCRDALRYKNSIPILHDCAHAMRDAYDRIIEGNEVAVINCIQSGLTNFASAFKFITGHNCRACIKIIQNDDANNFYTATLSRSGRSSGKTSKDEPNEILKNTDFLMLFNKQRSYFLSNDLSGVSPYHNSNWPDDPSDRHRFVQDENYDYISTLVWPIRSCNENDEIKVIGFLCVDSKEKNIFNQDTDIDFGASIADLLYPVLFAYRSYIALPKEEGRET